MYFITYFGFKSPTFERTVPLCNRLVIIDDVFSPYPSVVNSSNIWYSFNSLRKISPVADFNLIYSSNPITKAKVKYFDAFAKKKYQAKNKKYHSLHGHGPKKEEAEYLNLFSSAETLLDKNVGIFNPSSHSVVEAIEFYSRIESERLIRKSNYKLTKSLLPTDITLDITSDFYSFLPILIENRNEVRRQLMNSNIFLAIHWPDIDDVENKLSRRILSLPLDSRYSKKNIQQLCTQIKKALKRSK